MSESLGFVKSPTNELTYYQNEGFASANPQIALQKGIYKRPTSIVQDSSGNKIDSVASSLGYSSSYVFPKLELTTSFRHDSSLRCDIYNKILRLHIYNLRTSAIKLSGFKLSGNFTLIFPVSTAEEMRLYQNLSGIILGTYQGQIVVASQLFKGEEEYSISDIKPVRLTLENTQMLDTIYISFENWKGLIGCNPKQYTYNNLVQNVVFGAGDTARREMFGRYLLTNFIPSSKQLTLYNPVYTADDYYSRGITVIDPANSSGSYEWPSGLIGARGMNNRRRVSIEQDVDNPNPNIVLNIHIRKNDTVPWREDLDVTTQGIEYDVELPIDRFEDGILFMLSGTSKSTVYHSITFKTPMPCLLVLRYAKPYAESYPTETSTWATRWTDTDTGVVQRNAGRIPLWLGRDYYHTETDTKKNFSLEAVYLFPLTTIWGGYWTTYLSGTSSKVLSWLQNYFAES